MDFVSVIIPCRNESRFIGKLFEGLAAQSWPGEQMEIIVADGMSDDGTWEILTELAARNHHIHLLRNEHKVVPHALNAAIRMAKGSVILRMDAHSGYPPDYIEKLVSALSQHHADNTGGVWLTRPANNSAKARAIAHATSHPLGIGNAVYRLGADHAKLVDTVPYGCFRRDVFHRFGYFDEDLVRNQDDELNARIIKGKGRIMLIPDVKIDYFAREDIGKMMRMFYQYGLFKPLVNRKVGSPATIRQFAPPILVLASVLWLMLFILGYLTCSQALGFMALYLIPIVVVSMGLAIKHGLVLFPWLLLVFPTIHFAYGIGYIEGFLKWGLAAKKNGNYAHTVRDNR